MWVTDFFPDCKDWRVQTIVLTYSIASIFTPLRKMTYSVRFYPVYEIGIRVKDLKMLLLISWIAQGWQSVSFLPVHDEGLNHHISFIPQCKVFTMAAGLIFHWLEQTDLHTDYTGWPPSQKKKRNSRFSGLCSDQQLSFSPCWIEHLFLIIITPRSSNLVENFLTYE